MGLRLISGMFGCNGLEFCGYKARGADASPRAYQFALFILSPEGQRILASYGFSAPNLSE
jgi:hypothetical protein